jgi:lipopolysaccharide export LptBFGC system permease protein LptF
MNTSLLTDDEVVYVVETPPPLGAVATQNIDKQTKLERALASNSSRMEITFWVVLVLSIICMLLMLIVIIISTTLTMERKLLLGTIVGIVLFGIQIMLCVSRKEPHSLSIFTIICAFVSGLSLGMSVWYI